MDPFGTPTFWVPELVSLSGWYPPADDSEGEDVVITSIHKAKQFKTRAECQEWCDARPYSPGVPRWVAREHKVIEPWRI